MSVPPRVARILTPPAMAMSSSRWQAQDLSATETIQSLSAQTNLHQCRHVVAMRDGATATTTSTTSSNNKTSRSGGGATKPGDATQSTAASAPNSLASSSSQFQCVQRHGTLHPVLPWVAYVLEYATSSSNATNNNQQHPQHKTLVVQDTNTHQVHWSIAWMDLAACLYQAENAPLKLASAAKSLGLIVRLAFVDPSTLFWSGMCPAASASESTTASASYLLVQTTHRCLVLSLRTSPYSHCVLWTQAEPFSRQLARQALLYAHLEPATMMAPSDTDKTEKLAPSSNWLPLSSQQLYLVGCSDGSLQCWNAAMGQVVKSIRGLGGNTSGTDKDWITMLCAANPYHVTVANNNVSTASVGGDGGGAAEPVPASQTRRILAVTRKGLAYLMEIEWHAVAGAAGGDDKNEDTAKANNMMIEIKPPLARFMGGVGSISSSESAVMEHQLFHYDAHRDWILWLHPSSSVASTSTSKSKNATSNTAVTLFMWNLKALEKEMAANAVGGSNKSILKPEPTVAVQFPPVSDDSVMTVLPTLQHSSFHEDVVVCAVATSTGGFWLQAASTRSRTATAVPIVSVHMSDLLQNGAGLDQSPMVRVHGLLAQPMGDKAMLGVVTNLGIVVLDLPAAMGDRHLHLGAGLGTFGKSLLSVHNSELSYGSVDVLKANPYGIMEPKNPVSVYESPLPVHLPMEYQKRPFRLTPNFLLSPSGLYVCLFNPGEFRYEILHLPSLLQRVGQQRGSTSAGATKPLVASGTGIASFAWVGDDDCFAILHADDWMQEVSMLITAAASVNSGEGASGGSSSLLAGVTSTTKMVGGAAALVGGATLNLTKAAKSTTMAAATGATKAATMATTTATKTAVSGLKKGAKLATFGVFSKMKKKKGDDDTDADMGMSAMTEDIDESGPSLEMLQAGAPLPIDTTGPTIRTAPKKRFVELKELILVETSTDLAAGSVPAATSNSLGNLTLRGGGQNLPAALFGGPVLCIATQTDGNNAGHAHFYTLKPDEKEKQASLYVSSGPTLPFPDHCVWDDDGILCAIVLGNRVSVYLSECPEFVLLGSVRIGSGMRIQNVKFIHAVLYCCTWNSIHCILLGDLEGQVCNMDSYMIASSWFMGVPNAPLADGEYKSLSPPCVPLPLIQPAVLGYQNGSLLISTARGVFALPLNHPILRIGLLLASGQVERASKWLDAIPDQDHEAVATFLERRGQVTLALEHLSALSLETVIDISMRYGLTDRLCELVEEFGVKGLRAVDLGRGYSSNGMFGPEPDSQSLVACVGAYLLAQGKVELVRRLASELLRLEDGRKDALLLATFLVRINESDGTRLMWRAVDGESASEWAVGAFVRDHILKQQAHG